jgi:hypothetical protein
MKELDLGDFLDLKRAVQKGIEEADRGEGEPLDMRAVNAELDAEISLERWHVRD